jgi:hypothetical protein
VEIIPPDDIATEYGRLIPEQKSAVTNVVRAARLICASSRTPEGEVVLDWQAEQSTAIHFITGMIMTGRDQFGKLWLDELKNRLSQME